MTNDATLHQDVRKLLSSIEALLTHGSGGTKDPVLEMINDLSSIRDSLEQCARTMVIAASAMQSFTEGGEK
ncbi:hypothetical protein Q4555_15665 [Octadecabacter sp. 1_MG-2023]|uniref:hypothetical protein n=1 Tax=unclassified Octadecabacter TaxID=196158 RepID=UPI001C0A1E1A|nr:MULTISPECIES: hypothetical protein [unclassified Octadecabacter]MBU2994032.1 hypothetical protein [Octadecabacter sp. B2R22]MDO6736116.1 hypothetical protein [Octadecabacter sp. 1_MG-2023]